MTRSELIKLVPNKPYRMPCCRECMGKSKKDCDENWTTQDENIKYSCKYGHWQVETPYISQKDVEFIYQTLNELNRR